MGPIDDMARNKIINNSPFVGKYDEEIDPESAYEIITKMKEEVAKAEQEILQARADEKAAAEKAKAEAAAAKEAEKLKAAEEKARAKETKKIEKYADRAIGNIIGSASSTVGRSVMNKIIKGFFK
jgi:membrane protein involved in colicin uptake